MRHFIMGYDYFESTRQMNQWMGATAKAFWGNPAFGFSTSPIPSTFAAWGKVTEHAFDRVSAVPDWGIDAVVSNGRDYLVDIRTVVDKPFCNLVHFKVDREEPAKRHILLIAPLSGHHATLVCKTVLSLLPDCDVFVTEWKNARDVPLSKGKFDIEDATLYLLDFMEYLGGDLHVIAVCQPAPLALAATAYLAEIHPERQPKTLTLIGGPIDPAANPTEVTDFGRTVTMGQLENLAITKVGSGFAGIGRSVYPGAMQLASFISMNWQTHYQAYRDQIFAVARGRDAEHDRHNLFYDEYLAVLDMTEEFYLSTVKRIFKDREVARNKFVVNGHQVDIGKISDTAVLTVEGERDDISAPGQCSAALKLLTGLDENKKQSHLAPDAGHYGIFSGKAWRRDIRPIVLDFIDKFAK